MERVRGGLFPRLSAMGAAMVALVSLTLAVAGFLYAASANSTAGLTLSPSPFNEQRAFEDLKRFTELGPRPPGSDAHDWAYLFIHLGSLAPASMSTTSSSTLSRPQRPWAKSR